MLNIQIIIAIIFIIPIYQLLFYTTQLLTFKKSANNARWYMGLLLLCLTTFLIINSLYYLGYNKILIWAYQLYIPTLLLIVPLFYKYLISITTTKKIDISSNNLVLFMPSIIILVLNIIIYGGLPYEDKNTFLLAEFTANANTQLAAHIVYRLGSFFAFIQVLYYTIKSITIINNTKANKEEDALFLPFLQINWTSYILYSLVILILTNAISIQVAYTNTIMVVAYNLIVLLTGFAIGSFALKQENLYQYITINSNSIPSNMYKKINKVKRKSTKIESTENLILLELLKKLMLSEKPYLNSKLTIDELAHTLNINKRHLSNIINDETGSNVYSFINDYRICEFKKIIKDPKMDYLSIEGLSQKAGFNSKSSFNTYFKKATGCTPSQFRKDIKALQEAS